ncbi:MAG: fibronectin type III domain-containing protein, partial [Clostridiales bacterium]|nr:fibronectin type III domain-containing protein [Clostridiales bacterium]
MKFSLRRFVATFVCLAMVFGSVPIYARADNDAPPEKEYPSLEETAVEEPVVDGTDETESVEEVKMPAEEVSEDALGIQFDSYSDVESITSDTLSISELDYCNWQYYDDMRGYYFYDVSSAIYYSELMFTLALKDSQETVQGSYYDIAEAIGEHYLTFETNQGDYAEHWLPGNTYTARICIDGNKVGEMQVYIAPCYEDPSSIESVSCEQELHIIEGTFTSTDSSGNTYYRLNDAIEFAGDSFLFTITYNDDRDPITNDMGDIHAWTEYQIEIRDDQSTPWVVGESYYVEIAYLGVTGTMSVVIDPVPVESVTCNGELHIMENTYGTYYEEGFFYRLHDALEASDITFTITYNNEQADLIATYREIDDLGYGISYSAPDNNFFFTTGQSYQITISYLGVTGTMTVVIDANPVSEIICNGTVQVIENYHGYEAYDDENSEYFFYYNAISDAAYYYTPYNYFYTDPSMTFTIKYNDEREDFVGTAEEIVRDTGYPLSMTEITSQYESHWTAGETYLVQISYMGVTGTANVSVIPNPVKSITCSDLHVTENTFGYIDYGDDDKPYFYYDLIEDWASCSFFKPNPDMVFTISFNDDREDIVGTAEEITDTGACLFFSEINSQYYEHWVTGGTYQIEVSYMGAKDTINVVIDESMVESISCNRPYTIIENSYGEWEYDYETDSEYFFYYPIKSAWGEYEYYYLAGAEDMIFTITFKDDREDLVGTAREIKNATGQSLTFRNTSNQEETHWEVGGTYGMTVSYGGVSSAISVSIILNPVKSITCEPLHVTENTYGYNGGGYFEYDIINASMTGDTADEFYYLAPKPNLVFTIEFNDEREDLVGTAEEICLASGNILKFNYIVNQYPDTWVVGGQYAVTVTYLGFEGTVDVVIDENPFKSITCSTDLHINEHTGGYWSDEIYCYDLFDYISSDNQYYEYYRRDHDLIFTIEYKDERDPLVGTAKEIYEQTGSYLDFSVPDEQGTEWTAGNTYYFTVTYRGFTDSINVTIDASPVKSITCDQELHVIENTCGYWDTDASDELYYYYNILDNNWIDNDMYYFLEPAPDMIYTISFTDERPDIVGTAKEIFEQTGIPLRFSEKGNQDENHLVAGNSFEIGVSYLGYTGSIYAVIDESPVESITWNRDLHMTEHTYGDYYEDQYWYELTSVKDYNDTEYECLKADKQIVFTITYKDETVISGTAEELARDYGISLYFYTLDKQGDSPWVVGGCYRMMVSCLGCFETMNVYIDPSPVESITVGDVTVIENTNGYWTYDMYGERYYHYNVDSTWYSEVFEGKILQISPDTVFTIKYKDDRADVVGTSEEILKTTGESLFFKELKDQYYGEHWECGKSYGIRVSYLGCETILNVTVVESPIANITSAGDVHILENSGGYWSYTDSEKYFEYSLYSTAEGDKYNYLDADPDMVFTILYKDNTTISGTAGEIYELTGERIYFSAMVNQEEQHWLPGGSYGIRLDFLGGSGTMNAVIDTSPVASITCNDLHVMEHTNGYWCYTEDDYFYYYGFTDTIWNDEEHYEYLAADPDMVFTIKYNDERPDTVGTARQINESTGISLVFFGDLNQYDTHLVPGGSYEIGVSYLGGTGTISVFIEESPVVSITSNRDLLIRENTCLHTSYYSSGEVIQGYTLVDEAYTDDGYYNYLMADPDMVFTVKYKDGSELVGTAQEIFEQTGLRFSFYYTDDLTGNYWNVGESRGVIILFQGGMGTIQATVVESPVSSITCASVLTLQENTGGYWMGSGDGEWFFYQPVSTDFEHEGSVSYLDAAPDMIFTVKFSDEREDIVGTAWQIYEQTGERIGFTNVKSQEDRPWAVGGSYELEMIFMGRKGTVNVMISSSPIASISCIDEYHIAAGTYGSVSTNGDGETYYYYDVVARYELDETDTYYSCLIFAKDEVFTITYKNGTVVKGTAEEIFRLTGESLTFVDRNEQNEEHWMPGNTYDIRVSFLGFEKTLHISIDENSITGIEVSDVSIDVTKDYVGNWSTGYYGEPFFYYWLPNPTFTITYSDGSTETVAGGSMALYDATGYWISFNFDQTDEHWYPGHTYEIPYSFLNMTGTFSVVISESPISSITTEPSVFTVKEGTCGCWTEDWAWDELAGKQVLTEWFCYNAREILADSTFTISYKDTNLSDTIVEMNFAEGSTSELILDNLKVHQSVTNEWDIGEQKIYIYYRGYEFVVPVIVIAEEPEPDPLNGLVVAPKSGVTMTLSWEAVSGAYAYDVWFAADGDEFALAKSTGASQTSCSHTGLKAGTRYNYYVTARNTDGKILAKSDVVNAVALATPTLNEVVMVPEGLALAWSKASGADRYNIYRSETANGKFE